MHAASAAASGARRAGGEAVLPTALTAEDGGVSAAVTPPSPPASPARRISSPAGRPEVRPPPYAAAAAGKAACTQLAASVAPSVPRYAAAPVGSAMQTCMRACAQPFQPKYAATKPSPQYAARECKSASPHAAKSKRDTNIAAMRIVKPGTYRTSTTAAVNTGSTSSNTAGTGIRFGNTSATRLDSPRALQRTVRALPSAQAAIDYADAQVQGAHVGPLPGSADPDVLECHAVVPDVDASYGAVHIAQMQRRERARTTVLLQAGIASDGTLRSLADPIWDAPPTNAPPSSGNPAAMWGARPYKRVVRADEPTHPCSVSQCHPHWQLMHMAHCER